MASKTLLGLILTEVVRRLLASAGLILAFSIIVSSGIVHFDEWRMWGGGLDC